MQAGGLSVFHEGLCEYELVELGGAVTAADTGEGGGGDDNNGDGPRAHGLALTLLRATGMLSRLTMANRPLPAGPVDHLEGPQLQGPRSFRYAVAVGVVDAYALADDAFGELPVVSSLGGGTRPTEGSLLSVGGAELSAFAVSRRAPSSCGCSTPPPQQQSSPWGRAPAPPKTRLADPGAPVRGYLVDLRGRLLAGFEGSFELGPHCIATARLAGR